MVEQKHVEKTGEEQIVTDLAEQIVTMFSENKATIRQAKLALNKAGSMLVDVVIHLPK